MSRTDGWERVSPVSVLFYIGQVVRGVARNFFQAVVPAAVFLISTGSMTSERLYAIGTALALITILVAIGRYLRFRFRIEEDAIRIRQGIFRHEELDIGFDRIQGINTTQNPLYRWLGLVDIKLDTAGSAGSEGHLPAVPEGLGDSLRRHTRGRRDASVGSDAADPADTAEQELLALSAADMVRIGLTSNRGLLLLAFLAPLVDNLGEELSGRIERWLDPLTRVLDALSGGAAAAAALLFFLAAALLLAAISIAGAFFRHYRYALTTDGAVIRSRAGLISRHEHSMGLGKLQVLRIRQGPLLGYFDAARIVAKQAASHAVNTRKSFLIPLVPSRSIGRLRSVFFGREGRELDLSPDSDAFQPISRRYIRSRTLLFGGLAAAVILLQLASRGAWTAAAVLTPAALAIAWLAARRRYAHWGLALTPDAAVVRQGFFGTTLSVFLLRKVQRVDIVQSPFQRRHGLVTMEFVLAADTVTVPWIDESVARELCDYVLYRVETSRLAWL